MAIADLQASQAAQTVGYLTFRSTAQPGFEKTRPIFANIEFDIGRSLIQNVLEVEDRSISNHHLRLHCVIYEDDDEKAVEPMVYVQVLSSSNGVRFMRAGSKLPHESLTVRSGQNDVLLEHGHVLQLTCQISIVYHVHHNFTSIRNRPQHDIVRKAEMMRFSDRYLVTDRLIGVGGYASVYFATKRTTQQQLACKIISSPVHAKLQLDSEGTAHLKQTLLKKETLAREYNILKNLSHPNIVSLEKVIYTTSNIYIFQELITGGDLLSYLDQKGPLAEPHAAIITRQLLEAVDYLHENKVVHRDIKPENVLLTSWREGARIMLTDFGQSRMIDDVANDLTEPAVFRMRSVVGTHGYTAPEVYRQIKKSSGHSHGYSKAVDIWSIGSITPALLTNDFIIPVDDKQRCGDTTLSQYEQHMQALDYNGCWVGISDAAKSFIRGCLETDDEKRLTAKQALAHEWFTKQEYEAELNAAYSRAIQNWTALEQQQDVIEVLAMPNAVVDAVVHVQTDVASRHFALDSAP